MKKYKTIVIGGGTSGLKAAIMSSKKSKTLLIEPGILGGTCLNTGCIPTKAMIYASHLFALAKEMPYFGIEAKPVLNFKKMLSRVNSISEEGRQHIYKSLKKNNNLDLVKDKAKFIGIKKLMAGDEAYEADNIIIATGAKNFVPPIPGLKETGYLDNESVLSLENLPKSIVMIGGGYISMEYASFFSSLGTKVTVIEMLPEVLSALDNDVREVLLSTYKEKQVNIITNAKVVKVAKGEVYYVKAGEEQKNKNSLKAEAVFLAAGRLPNTQCLDLDKSSINYGRRGEIIVDDYLETSCKGVYAIGDCNGHPMFAHSAKRQTIIAVNNIFSKNRKKMDFSLVPWAIFSDPVVAGIGLNESMANKMGLKKGIKKGLKKGLEKSQDYNADYNVMKVSYIRNGRAKIIESQKGFVKILYNSKTKKIMGARIVGPNADDIIHEIAALMYADADINVLKNIIHVHPTLSEVLDNLREA